MEKGEALMAQDEAKVEGVKDYLRKANLTAEEAGHLAGWLFAVSMGQAFKEATEE